MKNNGAGIFTSGSKIPLPGGSTLVGDWNGDGRLDIASDSAPLIALSGPPFQPYKSALSISLGNGDGTFGPPVSSASWGGPYAVGDLNGDGLDDIVMGNSVVISKGDGSFSQPLFLRLADIACPQFPFPSFCGTQVLSTFLIQLPGRNDTSLLYLLKLLNGQTEQISVLNRPNTQLTFRSPVFPRLRCYLPSAIVLWCPPSAPA